MSKRQSYSQEVFPTTFEFTSRLEQLSSSGLRTMLGSVWQGYDSFKTEVLDKNLPPSRDYLDLERDLTEMLYPHIIRALSADLPYYLQHEKKERETSKVGKQPPEPDLSFVFFFNIRVTFPMDVKIVAGDRIVDLDDYTNTIIDRFLSCVYGPFSKEGAMLSFLLAGSVRNLFQSIGNKLQRPVSARSFFPGRNHRTSQHQRTAAQCRYRPFRCHHLVFAATPVVIP
jgi:hypothetical protein